VTRIASSRRIAPILAVAVVAAATAGCGFIARTGEGPVLTENRPAGTFSTIEVGSSIRVRLTIGPAQPLIVHAQQNLMPLITTRIEGNVLKVDSTQNFTGNPGVEVVIVTPALQGITVTGAADARVDGLDADRFDVFASGAGHATIVGSARSVSVTGSGGARASLDDLAAGTVSLTLAGGANAVVNASDSVTGNVSGGAHATIRGNAKSSVQASGGASVSRE
jgi:hypothetical protein